MGNLLGKGSLIALALLAIVTFVPAARAQNYSDWSPAVNLGPVLNTGSVDGCPFVAKNGLTLYFASNRPGGFGGQDIYVSQRADVNDPWGPPQNLGSAINSASNELCPTLTIDGHRLFFVSDRPGGCGGAGSLFGLASQQARRLLVASRRKPGLCDQRRCGRLYARVL